MVTLCFYYIKSQVSFLQHVYIYMADWSKLTGRGNVEDRRGVGPVAGGVGVVGVIAYLVFNYLSGGGIDVNTALQALQQVQVAQTQNYNAADFEGADSYEVFTSTVLGSTNEMWTKVFRDRGAVYTPPKLVLFRGSTTSSCGGASSYVGPHYCPEDQTIYLDETFFDELTQKLGGSNGDVAQAYVIAHEVGHHAQHELGILNDTSKVTNSESIKLELEADCFAGLWLNSIKTLGVFDLSEVNEAIEAARAVGDDRIQEVTTGRINPEEWTHGASAERISWLNKGFNSGDLASCDTFNS
jgi:uncharacterized protein